MFVLAFCLFSLGVYSAEKNTINKTVTITTKIDLNQLYEDAITSVRLVPNNIKLEVNKEIGAFSDAMSVMEIETSIPAAISGISYNIELRENQSFCDDFLGSSYEVVDFSKVHFDGEELATGDKRTFLDFNNSSDSYKASVHPVKVSFSPFSSIIAQHPKECRGSVQFIIGVGL